MKKQPTTQQKSKKVFVRRTIGIDIGDQWSHYCILNEAGEVTEEGRFRTTRTSLEKHFQEITPARIAIENGTH